MLRLQPARSPCRTRRSGDALRQRPPHVMEVVDTEGISFRQRARCEPSLKHFLDRGPPGLPRLEGVDAAASEGRQTRGPPPLPPLGRPRLEDLDDRPQLHTTFTTMLTEAIQSFARGGALGPHLRRFQDPAVTLGNSLPTERFGSPSHTHDVDPPRTGKTPLAHARERRKCTVRPRPDQASRPRAPDRRLSSR